jgi:hypothetical protein
MKGVNIVNLILEKDGRYEFGNCGMMGGKLWCKI